eukprot:gene45790-62000_t
MRAQYQNALSRKCLVTGKQHLKRRRAHDAGLVPPGERHRQIARALARPDAPARRCDQRTRAFAATGWRGEHGLSADARRGRHDRDPCLWLAQLCRGAAVVKRWIKVTLGTVALLAGGVYLSKDYVLLHMPGWLGPHIVFREINSARE